MWDRLDIKAAVWAGILAGVVFMMLEMILVATVGGASPWGPPRMIAAIVMGTDVLPPPASFNLIVLLAAMIVHLILSLVLAFPLAWIISRQRLGLFASLGAGTVYGLIIYLVNFYGMTAVFPWFAMARTPITLLSHAAFGLVLGWSYHSLIVRNFAQQASAADKSEPASE